MQHTKWLHTTHSSAVVWWGKLDYFRNRREIDFRIAINGYHNAMKYHRTVNMIY